MIPEKLYRSGKPRESQLEDWIKRYRLKCIINFQFTVAPYEKELAKKYNVKHYHMKLKARKAISDSKWEDVKKIMTNEENHPLLFHCRSGVDRTGLVAALYRIEMQDWPLEDALREMSFYYHMPFIYPKIQQYIRKRFNEIQVKSNEQTPSIEGDYRNP